MAEEGATKTVNERKNANSEDTGDVARAVLLTEEREDGVDTRVRDVSIERVFKRRNGGTPVTTTDITNAIDADRGVSEEELSAIVYEESDTVVHLPTDAGTHLLTGTGTEACDVHHRVAVTLSDTGLGQSETLYQTFRTEDEANRFAEKIKEYSSYTFERHQGEPTLDAEWTGRVNDCPDDIAKSADSFLSLREAMFELGEDVVCVFMLAVCGGLLTPLPLPIALGIGIPLSFMLLACLVGLFERCSVLLSKQTVTNRITLHRENESVCTAEDVQNYVEPSVPTTHVGVTVEQQDGKILVSSKTVDAEWHIETEHGIVVDPSAKDVLESAEIHRLESGEADLRIQPATESRAVEETRPSPSIESKSGEWVLLPAETFEQED